MMMLNQTNETVQTIQTEPYILNHTDPTRTKSFTSTILLVFDVMNSKFLSYSNYFFLHSEHFSYWVLNLCNIRESKILLLV